MWFFRLSGVVCLALGLAAGAAADGPEMVDNPDYTNWADFAVGDSVSYFFEIVYQGGATGSAIMTETLVEKTDEQIVIERIAKNDENDPKPEVVKETFPRRIRKAEVNSIDAAIADPKTKRGEEAVKVGDEEVACTWYAFKDPDSGGQMKLWVSTKVPSRLVKMTSDLGVARHEVTATAYRAGDK